ncbi:MAG: hypothetical protein JW889_15035 [Verrucomicrobia bacterium]|nr:hypothetical protein [Verrucomicrobiota bacterium]
MRRRALTLCSLAAVCLIAGLARAEVKADLKYQDFTDASDPLANLGRQWTSRLGAKPPVKGVPDGLSEKTAYFRVQTFGKRVLLLIDPTTPPKLYVDSDIDLDFADETAVAGEEIAQGQYRFGPLSVKDPKDKDGAELRFAVLAYVQQGNATYAMLVSPGSRMGTARLGDTEYAIALVDGNLDGQFGAAADAAPGRQGPSAMDFLAIDLNGNGRFEADAFEIMPLCTLARIGGAYYDVAIEADGSAITFDVSKMPLGTLATKNPTVELILASPTGNFLFERTAGGSWQVPAGTHTISKVRLAAADADGKLWSLDSLQIPPRVARVAIEEGKETILSVGPPLTFKLDVTVQNRNVEIDLDLTDGAGVPYLSGATKDGRRLQPPKIRIVDENGKELYTAAFSYG